MVHDFKRYTEEVFDSRDPRHPSIVQEPQRTPPHKDHLMVHHFKGCLKGVFGPAAPQAWTRFVSCFGANEDLGGAKRTVMRLVGATRASPSIIRANSG